MDDFELITKKKIIKALREDTRMLQDYFSNVYRSRIDPTVYRIKINDLNDAVENFHTKISGSDYIYGLLKKCLAEYYYIRNDLRRHGDEYSLGNLEDYFNRVDTLFAKTCDELIKDLIEIRSEEELFLEKNYK